MQSEESKTSQADVEEKAGPIQSQMAEKQVLGVSSKKKSPPAQAASAEPEIQGEEEPQGAAANPGPAPRQRPNVLSYHAKIFMGPKKNRRKYDRKGRLICNGIDLCDCLLVDCAGCFKPCPRCNSRKCSVKCRRNRKWVYNKAADESGELVSAFPFAFPE